MRMGRICSMDVNWVKATVMMVVVQLSTAGVNVFYKLASNDGMSIRVMVAYRFVFASAAVVPLALYFERNSRPKLTRLVTIQAFICALFGGTIAQNLYGQSLVMTSATFASAATNLVPALTFIMAVFFRLEKFDLKSMAGRTKVIGTIVCICGAMILTYYRGFQIKLWPTRAGVHNHGRHLAGTSHSKPSDHLIGSIFVIASALCSAFSLIFRAKMSRNYPFHYSSAALICLMGCVQAVVFALCMENKHWHNWKMGWNIRLLAVAYSGVVASGLSVILIMWCVRMRGPLFVSVFNPLTLVLVALTGTLFLDEKLYLGSVLGAFVIVCGLYSVLWGNAKDPNPNSQKSDDHHKLQFDEMIKIVQNNHDEDVKHRSNLEMAAINEIAPDLPASTAPGTRASDHEDDQEDYDRQLEEGSVPMPKRKA